MLDLSVKSGSDGIDGRRVLAGARQAQPPIADDPPQLRTPLEPRVGKSSRDGRRLHRPDWHTKEAEFCFGGIPELVAAIVLVFLGPLDYGGVYPVFGENRAKQAESAVNHFGHL